MKSTKAVFHQRVEQVLKIRLAGAQLHDIRNFAQEDDPDTGRPWNVTDKTLKYYISASNQLLARAAEKDHDKLLTLAIAQRETLYANAIQSGDWRAALAIADSRDKLLGLFPEKRSGPDSNSVNISFWTLALQGLPDEELQTLARLAERFGPSGITHGAITNGTNGETINGETANGHSAPEDEEDLTAAASGPPRDLPEKLRELCRSNFNLE
jgi:hypothetical protein